MLATIDRGTSVDGAIVHVVTTELRVFAPFNVEVAVLHCTGVVIGTILVVQAAETR